MTTVDVSGRDRWAKWLFIAGMGLVALIVASPFLVVAANGYLMAQRVRDAAASVEAARSPLIASVEADPEDGLLITLVRHADDENARDVWCLGMSTPSGPTVII